jgi:hypothetical protein
LPAPQLKIGRHAQGLLKQPSGLEPRRREEECADTWFKANEV